MHRILLVYVLPLLFSVLTWERLDLRLDRSQPGMYRLPTAEHAVQMANTLPNRLEVVRRHDDRRDAPEPGEWFGFTGVLVATSISMAPLALAIAQSPGFVH